MKRLCRLHEMIARTMGETSSVDERRECVRMRLRETLKLTETAPRDINVGRSLRPRGCRAGAGESRPAPPQHRSRHSPRDRDAGEYHFLCRRAGPELDRNG